MRASARTGAVAGGIVSFRKLRYGAAPAGFWLLLASSCGVDTAGHQFVGDAAGEGGHAGANNGRTGGVGGVRSGNSGGSTNGSPRGGAAGTNASPNAGNSSGFSGNSNGSGAGPSNSGGSGFFNEGGAFGNVSFGGNSNPSGASGAGGTISNGGGRDGASGSFATTSGGNANQFGGAPGAGGQMPAGECTPGARRCDPTGKIAQTCSASAHWDGSACPFVCLNDTCGGVCSPGARQCSGAQPQRCNEMGAWVADGAPCGAQCQSGACTGACKNDTTQCVSSTAVQTCQNGQWSAQTTCTNACVDQKCGGSCVPKSTHCASTTDVETCSEAGQWSNRKACDFVCSGSGCTGSCKPGDQRCMNGQQDKCNNSGQWEKVQTCPVCVNNACAQCTPNTTHCASPTKAEVCNAQGQWTAKTCANNACANNDCAACVPGDTRCDSTTKLSTCNDKGQWGTSSECTNACVGKKCDGVCKPGAATCEAGGVSVVNLCGDNGQFTQVECSGQDTCLNGKCDDFPRYIFVTSQVYDGNFGGLSGADRRCELQASNAGLPGHYKAFLVDSSNDIASRFKFEGGPFLIKDGSVERLFAFDWNWLLKKEPLVPLDRDENGKEAPVAQISPSGTSFCGGVNTLAWANVNSEGKLINKNTTCNEWGSRTATGAGFGNYDDTKKWKYSCTMGGSTSDPQFCMTKAPLICVQYQ